MSINPLPRFVRRSLVRVAVVVSITLAATSLQFVEPPPAAAAELPPRCAVGALPIAAGLYQSFALHADGSVWAAGSGNLGAPGIGASYTPVRVPDLNTVKVVGLESSGGATAAVTADGLVYTWGTGPGLGHGTTGAEQRPRRVAIDKVRQVSIGRGFMIALRTDGTVWAWGANNVGQLGVGDTTQRLVPVQVPGLTGVTSVAAGGLHALSLLAAGSVRGWGLADSGQLGIGTQSAGSFRSSPVAVQGLTGVTQIASGGRSSFAITPDGAAYSWGSNVDLQLGIWSEDTGAPQNAWLPTRTVGLPPIRAIASSDDPRPRGYGTTVDHTLAITTTGQVYAVGANYYRQLGNEIYPLPKQPSQERWQAIQGLAGVVAIDAGSGTSSALASDGRIYFWGSGVSNGDGSGTSGRRSVPFVWQATRQTPPAAPTELQVAPGPQLAYLQWRTTPQVITQYSVVRYDNGLGNSPVAVDPGRVTTIVRGLAGSQERTFTVAAQNCLGSATSARSEAVVPYGNVQPDTGFSVEGERLNDRIELAASPFTGNLSIVANDLRIPGVGVDLEIGRVYNSRLNPGTTFGGWQSTLVETVGASVTNGVETVRYRSAGGADVFFTRQADGTYTTRPGIDADLTTTPTGFAIAFDDGGSRREFARPPNITSGQHYLVGITDRIGNRIRITLNVSGQPISVTDTQGRVITLTYAGGKLAGMADSTGRSWTYEYHSPSNRLAASVDPSGGRTTYTIDTAGRITQITTPGGRSAYFYYDSLSRVVDISDPDQFASNTILAYTADEDGTSTVVTDPRGNATTYRFDPAGRAVNVTDGLGNITRADYTSRSNVSTVTSPKGGTTRYDYDTRRNLNAAQAATGATQRADFTDGANPHSPTTVTDAQANPRTFTYGPAGQVLTARSALPTENEVRATYNPNGTMSTSRDPRGNTTSYGYDTTGNLTSITPPAPLGRTTMSYDGLGRITRIVDGAGRSKTFEYDLLDRVSVVTDGSGARETRRWDPDGNQLDLTTAEGVTTMAYDTRNRLLERRTPDGRTVRYEYDLVGNMISYDDGTGRIEYGYNRVNMLASVREADGATTRMEYDAAYNRTTTALPNETQIYSSYDTSNRETARTTSLPGVGFLTDYYNYQGRPGRPADTIVRTSLDEPDAGLSSTYDYDNLNRLVRATIVGQATGVFPDAANWSRTFVYQYDGAGNMTSETITAPTGTTTNTYTYNAAGQLASRNGVTYAYDGAGNLTSSSDGSSYTYNASGQTTAITPPAGAGATTQFSYRSMTGQSERSAITSGGVSTTSVMSTMGATSDHSTSGTISYLREPSGALLGQRGASGRSYFVTDKEQSVRYVTAESDGSLLALYRYEPYGKAIAAQSFNGGNANSYSWRWKGTQANPSGTLHVGERHYDPAKQRWTQIDPMPQNPFNPVDSNLYVYAGSDPVNNVDPTGTAGLGCDILAGVRDVGTAVAGIFGVGALGAATIGTEMDRRDELAGRDPSKLRGMSAKGFKALGNRLAIVGLASGAVAAGAGFLHGAFGC